MRLRIEQDLDNSLFYVFAEELPGQRGARLSRGFKFESGVREWAEGFMDGYNQAMDDVKHLIRAHPGVAM